MPPGEGRPPEEGMPPGDGKPPEEGMPPGDGRPPEEGMPPGDGRPGDGRPGDPPGEGKPGEGIPPPGEGKPGEGIPPPGEGKPGMPLDGWPAPGSGSPTPGTLGCFGCGSVPFAQPPTASASATASGAPPNMFLTVRIRGRIVPTSSGALPGVRALPGAFEFASANAPPGRARSSNLGCSRMSPCPKDSR